MSPEGVNFACHLVPGCQHSGHYLCTPRREEEECPFPFIVDETVLSRGACSRLCHFDSSCGSFLWSAIQSKCMLCTSFAEEEHVWFFKGGPNPGREKEKIIKWYHGWHSGAIQSAWTGNIDLIAENYISPDPMGFDKKHILLPSSAEGVTYRFRGHNCLIVPWRHPLSPSIPVPMQMWKSAQSGTLSMCLVVITIVVILILLLRIFMQVFCMPRLFTMIDVANLFLGTPAGMYKSDVCGGFGHTFLIQGPPLVSRSDALDGDVYVLYCPISFSSALVAHPCYCWILPVSSCLSRAVCHVSWHRPHLGAV